MYLKSNKLLPRILKRDTALEGMGLIRRDAMR